MISFISDEPVMESSDDEEQSELSPDTDESASDTDEIEEGSNEAAFYPIIQEAWNENSEEWQSEKERLLESNYSDQAAESVAEQSLQRKNFKCFMKKYSEMIVVWYHLQLNELNNKVFDDFDELREKWNLEYAAEKAVKKHAAELKLICQQEAAEAELEKSDEDSSNSGDEDDDN